MSLGDPKLTLVETWDEARDFHDWMDECLDLKVPILGCDTETGGLDWWREPLRTVQFGTGDHGWVLPFEQWGGLVADTLERWEGPLVFQNAKFDLHFMERFGLDVGRHRIHDTRILAHLTNNDRLTGLKSLAATMIDKDANFLEGELKLGMKNHKWNWRTVPITFPAYWQYAALDPILTVRVWEAHLEFLESCQPLYDIELLVQQSLTDMERRGAQVDREYVEAAIMGLHSEMEELAERILEFGVDSPGSNAQITKVFIAEGVPLTERTPKGQIKLDESVLSSLRHPLADLVLKFRHSKKIAGTYLQNFLDLSDESGRLHPSVNQMGATTGRMSIGRPSMQNLERSTLVRDAIVASPGRKLVLIDYDQIEYRIMADYAGMVLIAVAARAGIDLHTATARLIYGVEEPTRQQRDITKNATFGKIYGAGLETFARTARITEAEAAAFIAEYDRANPEVQRFIDKVTNEAAARERDEGYAYVTTRYGRKLRRAKHRGNYVLVNYLIQGTAADVLKEKMARLALEGLDIYLIAPVHDELIFDVPVEDLDWYVPAVVECMEEHERFSVPLTVGVDIVDRWGDKYREKEAA